MEQKVCKIINNIVINYIYDIINEYPEINEKELIKIWNSQLILLNEIPDKYPHIYQDKNPVRSCVKVKFMRPEYDNLEKWLKNPDNVLATRRGRIFIKKDGENKIFHYKESEWHNPFKIDTDCTREECLILYEKHLKKMLRNPKILERFLELKNKEKIGCFCDPNDKCHVDVIIKYLKKYN